MTHSARVTLEESYARLQDILRGYGSCLVAYSGGVDSVFLARVAHDVLGDRSLAAIADSGTQSAATVHGLEGRTLDRGAREVRRASARESEAEHGRLEGEVPGASTESGEEDRAPDATQARRATGAAVC